jgi:hypothetical protein
MTELRSGKSVAPHSTAALARLARTIEGEIIPRLLVSLSGSLTPVHEAPDPHAVARLAQFVLLRDKLAAADIVRIVHPEAPPELDRRCLRLIAPTARRLGEIWERRECDFGQLVSALSRLESVIPEVKSAQS